VHAYQSKFNEAAKSFRRAGEEQLAINLFTDLRMFEQAKEYLSGGGSGGGSGDSNANSSSGNSNGGSETDKNSLLVKQAEWAMRTGDAKSAAEFYMGSKQYGKAIELAGKNKWPEMLLEIARKLDKADREALAKCADYFKQMQMSHFAAEVYEKMGNIRELVELRMQANQWDEVFILSNKYPELSQMAHYNYGLWLAENDMFEQAQKGKLIVHSNIYYNRIDRLCFFLFVLFALFLFSLYFSIQRGRLQERSHKRAGRAHAQRGLREPLHRRQLLLLALVY
jgi:intraflagellar transport protein 122